MLGQKVEHIYISHFAFNMVLFKHKTLLCSYLVYHTMQIMCSLLVKAT